MAISRRRKPRIGLALAGGGPEGAVYEIGALRALEEAIEGLDFSECDIYVGVSAGTFVAASLANGITPRQLIRTLFLREPGEQPFVPAHFFTPAYGQWAMRSAKLPRLLADALLRFTRAPRDQSLVESLIRLTRALPVSLFDNEPIRRYLAHSFSMPGRTDDFRQLRHQLYVVAVDLEAGTSIRFGEPGWDHVPISTAVQASTAVPGLYPPVQIEGRLCVDGVLLRTLHASVALERGADLVFCVNPLVPVDVAAGVREGVLTNGVLVQRGLPAVLSQTFRTLIHSRMVVGMARYKTQFPRADVVLFEPERHDYGLFFTNIFSFSARRRVVELAYSATRRDLWRRRKELAPVLRRHGLRLRTDVLEDGDRDLWMGVGLDGDRPGAVVSERLDTVLDHLVAVTGTAVTRRKRRKTARR